MTAAMLESLKHGLVTDGWLASQALLVWATDELGNPRNLIIDGEHRYEAARAVGMVDGPMVRLEGLTEAAAKALTVKMNQKRGRWNADALGALLQELSTSLPGVGDMGLELGLPAGELARAAGCPTLQLPADRPPAALAALVHAFAQGAAEEAT